MEKIKKTVIITGYTCNNKCQFCLDANKRDISDKTTEQIKKEMIYAKGKGSTYLELIGGEANIRPDIIELVKFAKESGFSTITMSTNGRIFSYRDFAQKMVEAGLNNLIFSIHGHTAKLHDSLTQVGGSFSQLKNGIENMKKILGINHLGSNTIIIKQNYKFLPQIGKFIYNLGIRNAEFIFIDPTYGAAHDHFLKFVPKISRVAPYIHQCLDLGKEKNLHWDIRYVPLCYFTNYLDQISELHELITFHTQHLAPDFINLNVENSRKRIARSKTKRCSGCHLFAQCEGIWKEYLKYYGDKELYPVSVSKEEIIQKVLSS